MRTFFPALTAFCLIFISLEANAKDIFPKFIEAEHEKGSLKIEQGVPIVTLRGTAEEIAEQHAVLLKKQLPHLVNVPVKMMGPVNAKRFMPFGVITATILRNNLEDDHQKELNELSKSSGEDLGLILVSNFLIELRRAGGCSTIVVPKEMSETGEILFGRNFDYDSFGVLDKSTVLTIFHPDGKHSFASIGFPGLTGVISGMNEEGLSIATLDVYRSNDGSRAFNPLGVPMGFAFRSLLENCNNVDEAIAHIKTMKMTTWMNLTVCDENKSVVLELTPKTINVRQSSDGILACTNHFRTKPLGKEYNDYRYNILNRKRGKAKISIEQVARDLHKVNQRHLTIQSMIFEPKSRILHLAHGKGPCSAKPMAKIDLKPLLLAKQPAP